MKTLPASLQFKEKLRLGQPVFGCWVTLESPTITEIACRMGFDFILVDHEHGHMDSKEVMEHFRIANLMGTTCIVHIPEIQAHIINRVLDLGADGFLAPQIRSAADVEMAVQYAKYPPRGRRGLGAERSTRWGKAFATQVPRANDETIVIPMVETVEAGKCIDEILEVPGIDAIFFGPADYSSSAGYAGQWEGPGVRERLLEIQARIRERGIPCGIFAGTPANATIRLEQKFQLIGLGGDTGFFIRAATEALQNVGREIPNNAWD